MDEEIQKPPRIEQPSTTSSSSSSGAAWEPTFTTSYCRGNLVGLPALGPNETEFVIEDYKTMRETSLPETKIYSPPFQLPNSSLRVRLMLLPKGSSSTSKSSFSAFLEALAPEIANEEQLVAWKYPDVEYYICLLDWSDWVNSKVNTDRYSFSDKESDRGWHHFMNLSVGNRHFHHFFAGNGHENQ